MIGERFTRAYSIVSNFSTEMWNGEPGTRRLRQLEMIENGGGHVPIRGPLGGSIFSHGIAVLPRNEFVRNSWLQYVGFFLRRGASPFCLLDDAPTRLAILQRYQTEIRDAVRRRIRHVLCLLLHSRSSPFRGLGALVLQMVLAVLIPHAQDVLGEFEFDCMVQRLAVGEWAVLAPKAPESSPHSRCSGAKRIQ